MHVSYWISIARRRLGYWFPAPATLEDHNTRLLYLETVGEGIWGGGTASFILVFLARLDASSLVIGAITAVPALITVLLSLPVSAWVEAQRNHVSITIRWSVFAQAFFLILAFLPSIITVPQQLATAIVLIWAVQSVPATLAGMAWWSVLGGAISSRRRPVVNGVRWALTGTFTAIFVALFGELLDASWLPFPRNYQVVFFISAVALFGSLAILSKMAMPVDYVAAPVGRRSLRQRAVELVGPMLSNSTFMKYLGATFVLRLGMALPVALYSIYWVRELGATNSLIGLRTTAGQVTLVIGYYLIGRLAARRGHRLVLIISAAGLGLYPILTALSPSPIWLIPAAIVWGAFTGGINISFLEGLFETAPPEKRPSFAALYTVFANLANVFGPLLGSALMTWLDIRTSFVIAGGLHVLGAGLCWGMGVGRGSRDGR